jgi:hypothetical protein
MGTSSLLRALNQRLSTKSRYRIRKLPSTALTQTFTERQFAN